MNKTATVKGKSLVFFLCLDSPPLVQLLLLRPNQDLNVGASSFSSFKSQYLSVLTKTQPQSFQTKKGPEAFPKVSTVGTKYYVDASQNCCEMDFFSTKTYRCGCSVR